MARGELAASHEMMRILAFLILPRIKLVLESNLFGMAAYEPARASKRMLDFSDATQELQCHLLGSE